MDRLENIIELADNRLERNYGREKYYENTLWNTYQRIAHQQIVSQLDEFDFFVRIHLVRTAFVQRALQKIAALRELSVHEQTVTRVVVVHF